jgi:hypothetical protein
MKRIYLSLLSLMLLATAVALGQTTSKSTSKSTTTKSAQHRQWRAEEHAERVARRAERLAAYQRQMDSIIRSQNYQFNPSTMQQQPAGPLRQLLNPNFVVQLYDGSVDICLPYIKGYVPPYYYTLINCVLPSVDNYRAEQTAEGWMITFSSSLFSANDYTFTFEVFSSSGGANLTISSVWYNPVLYIGTITQIY